MGKVINFMDQAEKRRYESAHANHAYRYNLGLFLAGHSAYQLETTELEPTSGVSDDGDAEVEGSDIALSDEAIAEFSGASLEQVKAARESAE